MVGPKRVLLELNRHCRNRRKSNVILGTERRGLQVFCCSLHVGSLRVVSDRSQALWGLCILGFGLCFRLRQDNGFLQLFTVNFRVNPVGKECHLIFPFGFWGFWKGGTPVSIVFPIRAPNSQPYQVSPLQHGLEEFHLEIFLFKTMKSHKYWVSRWWSNKFAL